MYVYTFWEFSFLIFRKSKWFYQFFSIINNFMLVLVYVVYHYNNNIIISRSVSFQCAFFVLMNKNTCFFLTVCFEQETGYTQNTFYFIYLHLIKIVISGYPAWPVCPICFAADPATLTAILMYTTNCVKTTLSMPTEKLGCPETETNYLSAYYN